MKKRIIAAVLAMIMISGTFAGCAEEKTAETNLPDEAGTVTERSAEAETEAVPDEEEGIAPEIIDFDGYDFRVYNSANLNGGIYTTFCEEITGDPVNDAVFNRDRRVEKMYNVTITGYEYGTGEMSNAVAANEDACDIAHPGGTEVFGLAQKNYILDFKTIPEINLDNPWWDQRISKELSIYNKVFTMVGDYTLRSPLCEFSIVFNQKLIEDYNMESPFSMVWDGRWTFDNMWEMAKAVSNDTNGDGVMDGEDTWGFVTEVSAVYYIFAASGRKTVEHDADGGITLMLGDENVIDAMIHSLFFATDGSNALCVDDGKFVASRTGSIWSEAAAMFKDNRILFRTSTIGGLIQLRDMEEDFGIVPLPKEREEQDGYYCLVSLYDNPMSIPTTVRDLSRTGTIIEALFWQSHGELRTALYETLLSNKLMRDEESVRMLDLVIDSKSFDLDWCAGITGLYSALNQIASSKNDTLSSKIASASKVSAKMLEKFCKAFSEGE